MPHRDVVPAMSAAMGLDDRVRLIDGAARLGVMLDEGQADAFAQYAELLAEWNTRMNLTRVPAAEFVERHFLDSLAACAPADAASARSVIDVGTGAGLPGIPWKIAYPELRMVLLDATRKRLDFLAIVVEALALRDVTLVHARAEDACRASPHGAAYEVAVARAVAPMDRLVAWLLPFVRPGGRAVALKSVSAQAEIDSAEQALQAHGGRIDRVWAIAIPGTTIERSIVVLQRRGLPERRRRP